MLDFTGPVTFAGPISVTNQVPDRQIADLIRSMERLSSVMAKVSNEIVELEKELGELTTVVAGTDVILDRIASAIENNIADEAKLRTLVASIRGEKEKIVAQHVKGTAAAEELEKEDSNPTPAPE